MSEIFHANKGPLLAEMNEGDRFVGFYILRNKQLESSRDPTRGYFLTLILSDRSGQRVGRVWENAEEANQEVLQGEVIKLDGEVETYLDRLQIRVIRVRPAAPEEYDIRDMLPSSRRDPQEMLAELESRLARVEHPQLAALINHFLLDQAFMAQFIQAPAAKQVHHAYLHGLMEHTLELFALADTVIELYPSLDMDLLFTAVFLHDIGKIREYDWELDIDYSDEGRLVGHIVLADEMLSAAIQILPEFPAALALRLRHMLLSHHGRYKWGSPRRPKTLEAIALHHIENLSAQVNRFQSILESRDQGEDWTKYDRMLKRHLYGGGEDDLSIEEQSWNS